MNTRAENTSSDKEQQLTLELLQAIDRKDDISQRHLAEEMGVALGLANSYLKRCVKKGWIKISTAPANRYLYYLTPTGFAEKARLTAEFLSTSLTLFRQSGEEFSGLYRLCEKNEYRKVLLVGISDLTEIALMRAMQSNIEIVGVFDADRAQGELFGAPVFTQEAKLPDFDCVLMTSMEHTSELLERMDHLFEKRGIKANRLLVPKMLLNMKYRLPETAQA